MATPIPENSASFVLGELAAACGGRVDPACAGRRVHGVVTDSRALRPSQLYVALSGERHDGHAFLPEVAARGAAAALVSDASAVPPGLAAIVVSDTRRALGELALLHRSRWGGKVVAITGSAGKTTTKELTAAALEAAGYEVLRTQGNLNNEVGLPVTLLCLTPAHQVAVVELGTSGPGEIAKLARIARADVGVVTTVSLAHTAGLGTLAAVADEKCALLRGLGADGVALYNADSEPLAARAASFAGRRRLSFGTSESADVRLLRHELGPDMITRASFSVAGRASAVEAELAMPGPGVALDAAAALAVLSSLDGTAKLDAGARGLARVAALPGRLCARTGPAGSLIVDDTYNANPASMRASLETLAELGRVRQGRAFAVLADMAELGQHSRSEHERVGRDAVRRGVSGLFLCGSEMKAAASAAHDEALRSGSAEAIRIEHFADGLDAAAELVRVLEARDAVLVKGSRSARMERVVAALAEQGGQA